MTSIDNSETSSVSSVLELEDISCPICLKNFANLQSLNDHLDTDHGFDDSPRSESDSVTTITSITSPKIHLSPHRNVRSSHSRSNSADVNNKKQDKTKKLEIKKSHWEKFVKGKTCNYCRRRLSPSTGLINCNKCGKLFCRRHCTNIIKLNLEAQFDPKGKHSRWYNCCYDCFISRPGYNEFGESIDLTVTFTKLRNKKSEDFQLIKLQLENRLVGLLDGLLALFKRYRVNGNVITLIKFNIERNALEQRITPWKSDNGVNNCHICTRQFNILIRKHHCRLCGNIICDSIDTGCSNAVPIITLRKNASDLPFHEDVKPLMSSEIDVDVNIRLCSNCLKAIYIPRKFEEDMAMSTSPIMIRYHSLQNVSRVITYLLPLFQDLLQNEEVEKNNDTVPNATNLQELTRIRERLLKSFGTYNVITRQLMLLTPENESEKRIQNSIQIMSSRFINGKILPLKTLGSALSPSSSSATSGRSSPLSTPTGKSDGTTTTIEVTRLSDMMNGLTIKQVKQYREELMVLKEQSYLIHSMITESKKQRKFDEIKTLTRNLDELTKRSQEVEQLLGDQGFK
ncbi:vacuolar segregation protein Pep7p [Monosporozyma unispora]